MVPEPLIHELGLLLHLDTLSSCLFLHLEYLHKYLSNLYAGV